MEITTRLLVQAVQNTIESVATSNDRALVDLALQDEHWALFIQDRFRDAASAVLPGQEHNFHPHRWVVPGWFAVYVYSQFFGWSGRSPEASCNVNLENYDEVARAFARLDELADPNTGAIKRPPIVLEGKNTKDITIDDIRGETRAMRQILRLYAIGAIVDRLQKHQDWLTQNEFSRVIDVVRHAYDDMRADVARSLDRHRQDARAAGKERVEEDMGNNEEEGGKGGEGEEEGEEENRKEQKAAQKAGRLGERPYKRRKMSE